MSMGIIKNGKYTQVAGNAGGGDDDGFYYDASHVQDMTSIISTAIQNNTPFTLPANCVLYVSYYAPIGVNMDVTINNIAIAKVAPPTDLTGVVTLMGGSSNAACVFNLVQDTGFVLQKAVAVYKATN